MQVRGTDYKTADGTCIRDYIDVTDLVDAHVKALEKANPGTVGIYNVGTGRGIYFICFIMRNSKYNSNNFEIPQNQLKCLQNHNQYK